MHYIYSRLILQPRRLPGKNSPTVTSPSLVNQSCNNANQKCMQIQATVITSTAGLQPPLESFKDFKIIKAQIRLHAISHDLPVRSFHSVQHVHTVRTPFHIVGLQKRDAENDEMDRKITQSVIGLKYFTSWALSKVIKGGFGGPGPST